MPINLSEPLRWTSADADETALLEDLQGNILDGHGRKATLHLMLRFGADAAAARAALRALEPQVTSALAQLEAARAYRNTGQSGGPFVGLLLSSSGYARLGIANRMPEGPVDGAFASGMLARSAILNDPAAPELEAAYQDRIDAMILIGGDPDGPDQWSSQAAQHLADMIMTGLGSAVSLITAETGRAIFRSNSAGEAEGIEHFGYVDGRSQPLLLQELVDREATGGGIDQWNAAFPLSQVLVPDPGSPDTGTAFGSYFVFRKLEQQVKAFKAREEELGAELGIGELAGAFLVGRFEDGTPVTLQGTEGLDHPVPNNFSYAADRAGARCPFFAHIRKTNPRGDVGRTLVPNPQSAADFDRIRELDDGERRVIMARRGMPYGTRNQVTDPSDQPEGGVGLMFMAFQSSIEDQFEFTQQSWANSPPFVARINGSPGDPVGRDPIIGQRGSEADVALAVPNGWNDATAGTTPASLAEFVVHKGGEYFFAPAKSMLRAL